MQPQDRGGLRTALTDILFNVRSSRVVPLHGFSASGVQARDRALQAAAPDFHASAAMNPIAEQAAKILVFRVPGTGDRERAERILPWCAKGQKCRIHRSETRRVA
jgi:uncharacterized protein